MRLFFFLCTLFSLTAKSQVVADFRADVIQGCQGGFKVAFTDLTNLPYNPNNKWFWDFGNGNTATAQNPGTVYFDPKSYTVTLTVEDPSGKKYSVTKDNYIVVNKSPAVDFAADKSSGCVPFTVQFADKSNAGSGTITKWQWDFGDGNTSSLQSPSHTFNVIADFNITLKVTNSFGCESVLTKNSYIHVNTLPKADFTSGSALTCNPPALVNFSSTSTGAGIRSAFWKFGDDSTASGTNTSHIYTKAGTYPVTLIVTNQNGCVDSITKPTVIGSVTPAFTAPDTVCQGAPTQFVNTSSPATASAYWDFGDNTSSSDINPLKSFTAYGSFMVKLVNNFGACKDSVTKKITVIPKPDAGFTAAVPSSTCKVPLNVSFKANTPSAASYLWDFGDGGNSTIANPSHTYTTYDSFTVKLIVSASNGCADTAARQKLVSIVPPKIERFNGLPFKGCLPHDQTFSAKITSPEPIASYLWDFGDGTTSSDIAPTHRYTVGGSYNISLKVTTANGCTDLLQMAEAVTVSTKPKADFIADPLISCAKNPVQFTDRSTGTITAHQWVFYDGGVSDETNPLHRYSDTGFFDARLIVSNAECYDTLTLKNYVYIKPPIARFNVIYDCEKPFERRFQNTSTPTSGSKWEFGDNGDPSNEINPIYTYKTPGTYYVHLHVDNGDCFDDFTDTIQVIDEHPNFTIDQTALCRNNTSVFTATEIDTKNIATYSWNFDDNTPIVTRTTPTVNHNYLRPGVFKPTLMITDILGCTRTVEQTITITVYGPNAGFTNPEGTCVNSKAIFKDLSEPTADHPITSWILDYGDGTSDTAVTTPGFSHTYSVAKRYDVTLIVTDSYGCKDTLLKPEAINITSPKALFSTSDTISCKNSTIRFINQSTGLNLTFSWDFGDGVKVAEQSPDHTFASEGNYTVSLAVKDLYGCTDTLAKTDVVAVRNAKASFTLSDSIISCPPTQINFVNTSLYSTSVRWDFDDGNFATIPDPSHYFFAARTYHIKLIAYGHGSCADSTISDITVHGPYSSFTYDPVTSCVPAAISFEGRTSNSNNSFTWDFGDGTATTTSESFISHVYTVPGKFLPKLLVTDTALNCKVSFFGVDTIMVSGAATFIRQHPALFCDSATLQFFDSTIVNYDAVTSYLWQFGDGATSNSQNPYHNYITPGVFPIRLVVKTADGCTDSSENRFVKIVKSPQVKITGAASVCVRDSVTFSGLIQPDTSSVKWEWLFGNGKTYNMSSPPAQTYSVAGKYVVKVAVTNSSGCVTTDSASLEVNPLPNVNAGVDSVICKGASFTLRPSGADTYVWAVSPSLSCTSCPNPVASPVDLSVYYVTGADALTGCQQTDSVAVRVVQPFKVITVNGDSICVGQQVKLLAAGADHYTWSPSAGLSNTTTADPVARPDATTLYRVIGQDNYNCFADTSYVNVSVYPNPVFNIIEDNITAAAGTKITLKTSSSADISNWQWFPATGLSCSNCPEPVATTNNTISYKAIASSPFGCKAEDRVTIQVFCNNGNVFIPNTFSPNNDGSNDVFYLRGKGIAGVKNLRIFNRWGMVVFEKSNFAANDPSAGWNGTYDGKPVDADVFIYQSEVICATGQVFSFKGDITLIR